MTRSDGPGGDERLADPASLRRIERFAVAWAVVAGSACGLALSWVSALVLTGAAVASIVAFRGLQRIVSALGPSQDEPAGPSEALAESPADPLEPPVLPERAGENGWRRGHGATGIGVFVRLGLLGAIAAAGAFLLEPEHFPAIILGFSTLPVAFMTEGLWQAVRAFRARGRDRHDGS